MPNFLLIAKREYLERIRTKSFLVMTVLIPLLMGGGLFGSVLMTKNTHSDAHVAVVSYDQQLATDLQTELEHGKDSEMTVTVMGSSSAKTRASLDSELADKELDGYLWIRSPEHAGSNQPIVEYKPRSSADIRTRETLQNALHSVLMREQLKHQGMAQAEVNALMQPVQLNTSNTGEADDSTAQYVSVVVLFLLMYFVIMLYGMNVARSIIEEKTSRVFEVMLATVRPADMMAGKMLGVGSVGLTQVAVWLTAGFLLSSTAIAARYTGGSHIHLSASQIIFFVIFFLLGYMLYSSIAAALGAMTNSEQELQQLNMFLVMPLALCMFALGVVVNAPDGKLATIMSLIPPFTPLIMYMRISLGHPSWLQVGGSIALMLVAIYAVLWIASRIYRVGILMYGKRPTLPEILRWLKYS
jgi:ABC-2 type transport system permease protein